MLLTLRFSDETYRDLLSLEAMDGVPPCDRIKCALRKLPITQPRRYTSGRNRIRLYNVPESFYHGVKALAERSGNTVPTYIIRVLSLSTLVLPPWSDINKTYHDGPTRDIYVGVDPVSLTALKKLKGLDGLTVSQRIREVLAGGRPLLPRQILSGYRTIRIKSVPEKLVKCLRPNINAGLIRALNREVAK